MRLSDVMSYLDLTTYPIIGLLCFVAVFLAVAWRALRSSSEAMRHHGSLPLDSDTMTRTAVTEPAKAPALANKERDDA